jgi:hypothetical protein
MPQMFWPNMVTKVHGLCENVLTYKNPRTILDIFHDFRLKNPPKTFKIHKKRSRNEKNRTRSARRAKRGAQLPTCRE